MRPATEHRLDLCWHCARDGLFGRVRGVERGVERAAAGNGAARRLCAVGRFKLSECVLFNGKPSARDEFDRLLTLLRLVATETASGRRRGPLFNQPETETTSSQARHRHVGSLQHAPEINRSITQS